MPSLTNNEPQLKSALKKTRPESHSSSPRHQEAEKPAKKQVHWHEARTPLGSEEEEDEEDDEEHEKFDILSRAGVLGLAMIPTFTPVPGGRPDMVVDNLRGILTRLRFYCRDEYCLCIAGDSFAAETDHDDFVERARWRCDDEFCTCQWRPLCTNPLDHYYLCEPDKDDPEEVCYCELYFCTPGHFPTRQAHDDAMEKLDRPFCCPMPPQICGCWEKGLYFPTEELHDRAMYPPDSSDEEYEDVEEEEEVEEDHNNDEHQDVEDDGPSYFECGAEQCICPPTTFFGTGREHDTWVANSKYPCIDVDCPCPDHVLFINKSDHDAYMKGNSSTSNTSSGNGSTSSNGSSSSESTPDAPEFVCRLTFCICAAASPEIAGEKAAHDLWVASNKYLCWDEDCPCGFNDVFATEEEHDVIMERRAMGLPDVDPDF